MKMLVSLVGFFIFLFFYWRFYYFLRDPPRRIPLSHNSIVSPADGKIVYVKKVKGNNVPLCIKKNKKIFLSEICKRHLPKKEYYIIGIFMNFLNVHIQRFPISGKITYENHYKNFNKSMQHMLYRTILNLKPYEKNSEYILTNERKITKIAGKLTVYVIQIADIYVNKIISFKKKGDYVEKGERLGLIKMGSQVDLILPSKNIKMICKQGDNVKAGESVLAKF